MPGAFVHAVVSPAALNDAPGPSPEWQVDADTPPQQATHEG